MLCNNLKPCKKPNKAHADLSEDDVSDDDKGIVDSVIDTITCGDPIGTIEIGYHKIRGLAAPLRMMCYYRSQPFTNVFYGADFKDSWIGGAKKELIKQHPAVNLPYIIHNDEIITQTNTCLLYLGRILNLDKESDFYHNHLVLDQVMDWRNDLIMIVYPPGVVYGAVETKADFPAAAKKHLEGTTKTNLTKLEGLCSDYIFMCGRTPQSGDFHLFEMIDQHKILAASQCLPDPTAGFIKMQKLWEAFKVDPKLAKYFDSETYKSYPHNNGTITHFTGQPPDFKYGDSGKQKVKC